MSFFYMPVKVFEETGAVTAHRKELQKLGTKALIVTGRHSAKACGAYDDVCAALDEAGIPHVLFDEVEENPSTDTVMRARETGLREKVDFVVGIGGGSPLDAAKAIALMLRKADRTVSYLYAPDGDSDALPIAAVPTTCGTGSEVTPVSVLTDSARGIKKSIPHKLFPQIALVDGTYLKAASPRILANTAFDALTHMIESYANNKATDLSRMCVDAGLKLWAESLPVLKGKKPAQEDLNRMMRASMLAGMAITHTSTTIPHGLSYALTTRLGVPHGKATAYFTAGYLSKLAAPDREYLLKTAGFESLEEFSVIFRQACGPLDAAPEALQEALEAGIRETKASPAKIAQTPFTADDQALHDIAYYELCFEKH